MGFQYLTNIPLEEARDGYMSFLAEHGFAHKTGTVPVAQLCGMITAAPVYAHICAPHYHASAMDGIAVKASDTFGAGETTPVTLTPEQYTVVDTGDPLPDGCDAVVMIEDVVNLEDGNVRLHVSAAPWQNIRQIGEDICAGEMILPAYTRITPAAAGAMIAGGVLKAEVICPPVIGIIPTGDEIVEPKEDPAPGDILEFNSTIFSSMVKEWGAEPKVYPICPDKKDLLKEELSLALKECDIVLVNAGSSAGREDYSSAIIGELGEVFCHGIAIKPGKPAILGACGSKPVIGVPGYPVSGIIVVDQLLKPVLDAWFNQPKGHSEEIKAILSRPVISGLKYEEFVRVRVGCVDGKYVASPLNRGAGVVSSFMKADGIMAVPQGLEGYEAGSEVTVRLLKPEHELQNTIVVIGSHDPLMDELSDLIHTADPEMNLSSSHVGSMGGIMAARRGEAHLGGVHLLDEADGTYNTSFIRKYFPNGGVRLVECVGRTQGLMIQKGNPKGIKGVADLQREGLRYVNRQKGSGTRILIDYLCKKENIDTGKIYGYDREEFTHTSVAAQIASDSADAGMGIYSAAMLYDLDFIPVCTEQYDLLIPDYAWETPMVQKLIEVLKSDAFRKRLEALGGYTIGDPGTVRMHF